MKEIKVNIVWYLFCILFLLYGVTIKQRVLVLERVQHIGETTCGQVKLWVLLGYTERILEHTMTFTGRTFLHREQC